MIFFLLCSCMSYGALSRRTEKKVDVCLVFMLLLSVLCERQPGQCRPSMGREEKNTPFQPRERKNTITPI